MAGILTSQSFNFYNRLDITYMHEYRRNVKIIVIVM